MSFSSIIPLTWGRDFQTHNESPLFPCVGATDLLTISPALCYYKSLQGIWTLGKHWGFGHWAQWNFFLGFLPGSPLHLYSPVPLFSSWRGGTGCDTTSILTRFPDLMWKDWVFQAFLPSDTGAGWSWNKDYCPGIVPSWECRQRMWMMTSNR